MFAATQEALVGIYLNQNEQKGEFIIISSPQSGVAMLYDDLVQLRLPITSDQGEPINDARYVWLKDIKNLSYQYEASNAVLNLQIAAKFLTKSKISLSHKRNIPLSKAQTPSGAYLNYDFNYNKTRDQLSGLAELSLFAEPGYGQIFHRVRFQEDRDQISSTRISTQYQLALNQQGQEMLSIGDNTSVLSESGQSIPYAGIELHKLPNNHINMPITDDIIGGVTETDSAVDLYINGIRQIQSNINSGPYEVNYRPSLNQLNEVELKLTDALGREYLKRQKLYPSSSILPVGNYNYHFIAARKRTDYSLDTNNYEQRFVYGRLDYGMFRSLSGGTRLLLGDNYWQLGLSSRLATSYTGELAFNVSHIRQGNITDSQMALSMQYNYKGFRLSSRLIKFPRTLDNFPGLKSTPFRRDRLAVVNIGSRLFARAHANCMLIEQAYRQARRFANLQCGSSLIFKRSTISITLSHQLDDSLQDRLSIQIFLPLGRQQVSVNHQSYRHGLQREQLSLSQQITDSHRGLQYTANLIQQQNDSSSLDRYGNASYRTHYFRLNYDYRNFFQRESQQASFAGSVALIDRDIFFTRPIQNAGILVDTEGAENTEILSNGRSIGFTNRQGRLIVTNANAQGPNRIALNTKTLPMNISPQKDKLQIMGMPHRISVLRFNIDRLVAVQLTLLDSNQQFIPAGSRIEIPALEMTTYVGDDGQVYLQDIEAGQYTIEVESHGQQCTATLLIPKSVEFQQDLGELQCQ